MARLGQGGWPSPVNEAEILAQIPRLGESGFSIHSPDDSDYNCIAWAAGDNKRLWWPGVNGVRIGSHYWPNSNTSERLDNFENAFGTVGYERCDSSDYEDGYEKIAIYVNEHGVPKHAARQFSDGAWTSKLGSHEDILHGSVEGVCGWPAGLFGYGKIAIFMRRKVSRSTKLFKEVTTPLTRSLGRLILFFRSSIRD